MGIILISLPVAIVGSKFQQAYEAHEADAETWLLLEEDERELLRSATMGLRPSVDMEVDKVLNVLRNPEEMKRRGIEKAKTTESLGNLAPAKADVAASIYPKLRAIHSLTPISNQSQAPKLPYKEAVSYLDRLRSKLEVLEDRPGLTDKTRTKVNNNNGNNKATTTTSSTTT